MVSPCAEVPGRNLSGGTREQGICFLAISRNCHSLSAYCVSLSVFCTDGIVLFLSHPLLFPLLLPPPHFIPTPRSTLCPNPLQLSPQGRDLQPKARKTGPLLPGKELGVCVSEGDIYRVFIAC